MSADLLLDNFHALAETPNGAQNLRELILSLAFAGRLVSQSNDDEPASEHTPREQNSTRRRTSKPLPLISTDEIPYELPRTWVWARLGEATNFGSAERADDIVDSTWVLDLEDIEKDTSRIVQRLRYKERQSQSDKFSFKVGDVLYGKLRPYLNKVVVADEPGVCTTEIIPIRPVINLEPKYLMYALKRPEFLRYVNERSYGMKMPRLGTDDARMALLPIAPFNEQRRIVAKVDQLMALCDELEKRQEKKHQVSIQLNEAALNKLTTASTPEEFAGDWQRIKQNFDVLYDTPENVGKLKQAILQLAVQGKLVPQDPKDEPASVLLEKIKAEKERLVKEKKIKESEPLPPIAEDEVPYKLPSGWVWARLSEVVGSMTNGIYKPAKFYSEDGIGCLRMYNINNGTINLKNLKRMDLEKEEVEYFSLKIGDLLVNRVNSRELVGKAAVIESLAEPLIFESKNIRVRFLESARLPRFANILFQTALVRSSFDDDARQTCGQASISQPQIGNVLIPLPPFQEQERIIAEVSRLMIECDELETRLTHTQSAAERLVGAVVRGVVAA